MSHLYGNKWGHHYGAGINASGSPTAALMQWAHDLSGCDDATLNRALQDCESLHPEWPPTVPQFKALIDRIPNVEEIIDLGKDYGPVCAAIRSKIDWYSVTLLPSAEMRRQIERKLAQMLPQMRREGLITQAALTGAIEGQHSEAIEGAP